VCAGLVFVESDDSASNGNLRCNAAKEARGGSWYTPGLLTGYAIPGNRQFAGSVRIPAPRTYQQRAYTPQFPEGEQTLLRGHTME
jgi:hypothetical protein